MDTNNTTLVELFFRVESLLKRWYWYGRSGYGHYGFNPHRGQGRVLSLLKMQPKISQKDLGYLLDMRNQSLGEILTKLEKAGYIERTPSDEDKRTSMISLTEAGVKAADSNTVTGVADDVFSYLNEQEQEDLFRMLEHVAKTLEEKLSAQEQAPRFFDDDTYREKYGPGQPRSGGPHGRGAHDNGPFGGSPRGNDSRGGGLHGNGFRRNHHFHRGCTEHCLRSTFFNSL